jgi:hypothetical protein
VSSRRELTAAALVGQLAEADRLRVVAGLVLGATTPSELVDATGLTPDAVSTALNRLLRSGLVRTLGEDLRVDEDAFRRAARAEAPTGKPADFGTTDPEVNRVLRAFVVDGRLRSIPAPGRKRRIVLEYLVAAFEPGVRYPEAEVNAVLRAWHPDYAALRRYLVEESYLSREAGEYWRSGGWVDVL